MPTDQLIAQGGLGIVVVVLVCLFIWIAKWSERQHRATLDVVTRNTEAMTRLAERIETMAPARRRAAA